MDLREPRQPSLREFFRVHSVSMLGTILASALGAGALAGWTTAHLEFRLFNLHASIWAFLVVWAAMVGYTAYKRVPSGVIAMGLYVMGLFVLLKPVVWYHLHASSNSATGEEVTAVQSLAGVLVWGLSFLVLAGVLFALGNYFRTRAESTALRVARRRLRFLK